MIILKWIKKVKIDQNEIESYAAGGSKNYFMIRLEKEINRDGGHIIGWGFCERYERTFLIFDTEPRKQKTKKTKKYKNNLSERHTDEIQNTAI